VKTFLDRALMAAITIMAVIVLLSWSWTKLRPLLPVLGVAVILAVMTTVAYRHWRNRYW